ncbi:MAG TPA: hypothetical protein VF840_11690 [Terriglobales bacterium]
MRECGSGIELALSEQQQGITQGQPTEVEVVYFAVWSHRFFGISDGPITTIHLGTVVPDENGQRPLRGWGYGDPEG